MSQAQQHKRGCPALGGYGHGKEQCACGAQQQPDNPLIDAARGRDTQQPPALRYAAALECMEHEGMHKAASELRRLHARVQELEAKAAQQPEALRLSGGQIAKVMELVDDFGLKCDEYGHSITKQELMGARRAVREKLRSLRVAPGYPT